MGCKFSAVEELVRALPRNFLVFGSTGVIGEACVESLQNYGNVTRGQRDESIFIGQVAELEPLDGVIWSQGVNLTDSIRNFEESTFLQILESNVIFILRTAKQILNSGKITKGGQLIVISSIWAQFGRADKLSYSTSKAAISAAVRSLAVDLGPSGIQVNSISPGPIESPMTHQNLTSIQIDRISSETPLRRLVTIEEVARIATLFAIGEMSGITGQDILVDAGWSVSKLV